MTQETATLILTVLGSLGVWTASVIAVILWLNNQFNTQRAAMYREIAKIRREYDRVIAAYAGRVQRLELRITGSTLSGPETELVLRQQSEDWQDEGP